jgi:hypothetical protein
LADLNDNWQENVVLTGKTAPTITNICDPDGGDIFCTAVDMNSIELNTAMIPDADRMRLGLVSLVQP